MSLGSGVINVFGEDKKQEAESITCTDSKGNTNGYGSKCVSGSCSCLPNPCSTKTNEL